MSHGLEILCRFLQPKIEEKRLRLLSRHKPKEVAQAMEDLAAERKRLKSLYGIQDDLPVEMRRVKRAKRGKSMVKA